ncbi:MAG: hypothetical protein R3C11_19805 [Planctomycetaceae bacterium]
MSRRRSNTEIEMGSDSFLDIIANIVGILIILIVIAAIRVSQSPVPTLSIETAAESVVQAAPAVEPEPVEAMVTPEPVPQVLELDQNLLAQVRELEHNLTKLQQESQQQADQIALLDKELQEANQKTESLSGQVAKLQSLRNRAEQKTNELHEAQEKTRSRINQLTRVLEEVEQKQSPTKELRHEVTPVSQKAVGKEIHFQIKNNQISVLPIDELIAEMKEEIPDNLNWLMKFNDYNGEVGPIRGFRMKYTVARESLSAIEQLQQGRGMMKVGVQRWELEEDELHVAESYEDALKRESRFQTALMLASANTTLTFWVYPDSFVTFQQIKEVVHQNGFLVAARPIPFGAPIAGSPNGTHSSSQ